MKAEELRSKSQDELQKFVVDQRKEQFNLRFQRANGALENTAQLRTLRRDIARAKTLMTEIATGKAPAAAKTTAKKAETKKAAPAKKTATATKKPAAKKTTTAKKKA